jgi:chromosome segregation ATPase
MEEMKKIRGVYDSTLASIEDQLAWVRRKLFALLQAKVQKKNNIDESHKKQEEELQASIAFWQNRLCDGMEQQMESANKNKLLAEKRAEIAEKELAEKEQQHKIEMDAKEQQHQIDMHEMQETFKKALAWERENARETLAYERENARVSGKIPEFLQKICQGGIPTAYKQSKPKPNDGKLCKDTRAISQRTRSSKRLCVEKNGPVRAEPWSCERCETRKSVI